MPFAANSYWTNSLGWGAGRVGLALVLVLPVAGWLAGASASAEEGAVTPRETIVLFNGTNLAGFYTWLVDTKRADPRRVFTVTNGMIRISGEGLGYLATEREYRDYRLFAEFKWGGANWHWGDRVGKARDSGIFLHATGPDGNSHDGKGAFMAAIECQVMQGAVGDFLLIRGAAADGSLLAPRFTVEAAPEPDADGWWTWRAGGTRRTLERWGRVNWSAKAREWKDQLDFRGPNDVESQRGEWTRVECVCDGARIQVTVNGTPVNEAREVFPSRGKILLQCEGSEILFRKLELRPLARR
jgi:hypothetical protein